MQWLLILTWYNRSLQIAKDWNFSTKTILKVLTQNFAKTCFFPNLIIGVFVLLFSQKHSKLYNPKHPVSSYWYRYQMVVRSKVSLPLALFQWHWNSISLLKSYFCKGTIVLGWKQVESGLQCWKWIDRLVEEGCTVNMERMIRI